MDKPDIFQIKNAPEIDFSGAFFIVSLAKTKPRFYRGNKNALVKIKRGEQWQATKSSREEINLQV